MIPAIEFPGPFAEQVATELGRAVGMIRAKGACAVVSLGPIYVEAAEQGAWTREQAALEARVAKLGLAASVVADGAISTDRFRSLDTYDHPTAAAGTIWADSVIRRLTSQSQSPCVSSLAKAGHLSAPS